MLTRYQFTFVGTTSAGDIAEGKGRVDAESEREAEAMVIGFANARDVRTARIDLTPNN